MFAWSIAAFAAGVAVAIPLSFYLASTFRFRLTSRSWINRHTYRSEPDE